MIGIDVRGIPEVQKALDDLLPGPQSNRMLQKATAAGGKALKPFVQAEAPVRTGKLRKSISTRQARRQRPATVVSPRPRVAFYRHFVIDGTKPHRIRFPDQKAAGVAKSEGNIRHPGNKANPFVDRGYEAGHTAAEAAVDKVVAQYVESI